MADKPIEPGDLVYVWKWHTCGCGYGVTGRVTEFIPVDCTSCRCCGKKYPDGQTVPGLQMMASSVWAVPVEWVRRIPPQQELEGKKTQEPTRAVEPILMFFL